MSSKIDAYELGESPTRRFNLRVVNSTSIHLAITGDSRGTLRSLVLTDSSQRSVCPNLVQKKIVSPHYCTEHCGRCYSISPRSLTSSQLAKHKGGRFRSRLCSRSHRAAGYLCVSGCGGSGTEDSEVDGAGEGPIMNARRMRLYLYASRSRRTRIH